MCVKGVDEVQRCSGYGLMYTGAILGGGLLLSGLIFGFVETGWGKLAISLTAVGGGLTLLMVGGGGLIFGRAACYKNQMKEEATKVADRVNAFKDQMLERSLA